jgi:hypothetical protein
MRVLNKSTEALNLMIVLADGTSDSIHLQPRGGRAAELPAGSQIDPTMVEQYRSIVRTDPPLAPKASPAPSPSVSSAPKAAD